MRKDDLDFSDLSPIKIVDIDYSMRKKSDDTKSHDMKQTSSNQAVSTSTVQSNRAQGKHSGRHRVSGSSSSV